MLQIQNKKDLYKEQMLQSDLIIISLGWIWKQTLFTQILQHIYNEGMINTKYLVVKQLFMWKLSSKTGRYW